METRAGRGAGNVGERADNTTAVRFVWLEFDIIVAFAAARKMRNSPIDWLELSNVLEVALIPGVSELAALELALVVFKDTRD